MSEWVNVRRKPQNICLPPSRPPNKTPDFVIPAGTKVAVSKVLPLCFKSHVTKVELSFERYDSCEAGDYIFRHDGYFIRVDERKVKGWRKKRL